MKNGLMMKRIYAYVRNSKPNPLNESGGFEKGVHEGDRVLVLSGELLGAIEVHIRKKTMTIPAKFLLPQRPTAKGQIVVIISGDVAGEVYVTREPNENGWFPLVRRGSKGAAKLVVEPNRLARCDPR
jgi:hypothetical protein